jgi:hypothetical protein
MDYISLALAKSGIPAAMEAAKKLLEKLVGPVSEEVGLLLQDKVRSYRLRNQLIVLGKTQDMLNKAGIEPKSVPLRVLVPLLEGAALEDDDNLSTKWAALLANAATPEYSVNLIPSFSNILSQLSLHDVKILDVLLKEQWYQETIGHESEPKYIHLFAFRPTIQEPTNLSDEEYDLSVDNIVRLGLCVTRTEALPVIVQQDLQKLYNLDHKLVRRDVLIATQLGFEFLKACSQPVQKNK